MPLRREQAGWLLLPISLVTVVSPLGLTPIAKARRGPHVSFNSDVPGDEAQERELMSKLVDHNREERDALQEYLRLAERRHQHASPGSVPRGTNTAMNATRNASPQVVQLHTRDSWPQRLARRLQKEVIEHGVGMATAAVGKATWHGAPLPVKASGARASGGRSEPAAGQPRERTSPVPEWDGDVIIVPMDAGAPGSFGQGSKGPWGSEGGVIQPVIPANSTVTAMPMTWDSAPRPSASAVLMPMAGFLLGIMCLCLFIDRSASQAEASASGAAGGGLASLQTKADTVFRACDRDRDGFVSHSELLWLARLTNPHTARWVSKDWFTDLCRPLGADPRRGLNPAQFYQSYMLLGHDVSMDYAAVTSEANTTASTDHGRNDAGHNLT